MGTFSDSADRVAGSIRRDPNFRGINFFSSIHPSSNEAATVVLSWTKQGKSR